MFKSNKEVTDEMYMPVCHIFGIEKGFKDKNLGERGIRYGCNSFLGEMGERKDSELWRM